jgi:hypothetical protein
MATLKKRRCLRPRWWFLDLPGLALMFLACFLATAWEDSQTED